MKKILLFFSAFIICTTFATCTQEEQEPVQKKSIAEKATSIEDLTTQLKEYNTRFEMKKVPITMRSSSSKIRLSLKDKIKIAITDAIGGTVGALFGGPYGCIVTGATASYLKRLQILHEKNLKIEKVKNAYSDVNIGNTAMANFTDSVGCYHNIIENELHSYYDNINYKVTEMELVSFCNYKMRILSDEYRNNYVITSSSLTNLCNNMTPVTKIPYNDDRSFQDYCTLLKYSEPSQAKYIDNIGEYLFTLAYANIDDPEAYTNEVLFQIKNSNVDVSDKGALYNGVVTAYASLHYSACIDYAEK